VPTRSLFLLDAQHDDPAPYDAWLATAGPLLRRPTATDRQVVSA
jgi:FMN reductase